MGKLEGYLPLRGKVGGLTYTHTKYGIVVKPASTVTKERIETDPAYQRTRENMAEFTTAARAGKLVSKAFKPSLPSARDGGAAIRLMQTMKLALNLDTTNLRGQRTVTDGDLSVVENFEFNEGSQLTNVLQAPFIATITRAQGELEVTVPAFDTLTGVVIPDGATHMRIVATGAEVDFVAKAYVSAVQRSAYLPLLPGATAPITLTATVTANSTKALMLALGLEFFQEMNGQKYPLHNGKSNCHTIVKVDA